MEAWTPNSTDIPNVILDYVLPTLDAGCRAVLLYVCRRTFGFRKQADFISVQQMTHGIRRRDGRQLDLGTGLSKARNHSAIAALLREGLITLQRDKHNDTPCYSLNLPRLATIEQEWSSGMALRDAMQKRRGHLERAHAYRPSEAPTGWIEGVSPAGHPGVSPAGHNKLPGNKLEDPVPVHLDPAAACKEIRRETAQTAAAAPSEQGDRAGQAEMSGESSPARQAAPRAADAPAARNMIATEDRTGQAESQPQKESHGLFSPGRKPGPRTSSAAATEQTFGIGVSGACRPVPAPAATPTNHPNPLLHPFQAVFPCVGIHPWRVFLEKVERIGEKAARAALHRAKEAGARTPALLWRICDEIAEIGFEEWRRHQERRREQPPAAPPPKPVPAEDMAKLPEMKAELARLETAKNKAVLAVFEHSDIKPQKGADPAEMRAWEEACKVLERQRDDVSHEHHRLHKKIEFMTIKVGGIR